MTDFRVRDETGRELKIEPKGDFICPFCGGRVTYGEEAKLGPLLLHTVPHCEKFDRLDIIAFVREARLAGARFLS